MSSAPGNNGCQLPEALRRYYLDAMGIQVWTRHPQSEPVVETPAVKVEVSPAEIPEQPADQIAVAVSSPATDARWQSLQTEVEACTKCALHSSRTRTVFGVGNRNADVLVIGEAPGQDEDRQGEPFVGRAGKLLDAMLRAIDLQREQVYIANILKCRPPGNRDPQPDEVAACHDYLLRQIELLQPRVIFAVGKIAAQNLLDTDSTLGAMRGKLHDYNGIPLIVSYHPAYLLRKPTEKRKSWQDLLRLRAVLN